MASLAICAAALGLWCVSSNRQAQQDAAARDAAAVSAPTAGSDDEPEWEAVVEEVVGLRREGVWCLAVLLVGLVIIGRAVGARALLGPGGREGRRVFYDAAMAPRPVGRSLSRSSGAPSKLLRRVV